ncbi:MAG: decarboxylating 6-phosphogluconate dehydrogenase [Pirellulaceae bacterium]
MKLGLIGLGKMGGSMAQRLSKGGHEVVGYDPNSAAVDKVVSHGISGTSTLDELIKQLTAPRLIWMMVPSGKPVDETIEALAPKLSSGDVLIDGGNSNYKDTLRRSDTVKQRELHFVDVGTSGGVWGLEQGYSMMVGGEKSVVDKLRPVFETLAPAMDRGWGHVGAVGSGHFVKMVHNGIEYGAMQAYAEGFAILREKEQFNLDLHQVAEIWRFGSVIRSWLLDLIAKALSENANLSGIAPFVEDSGEGRWTVREAIDLDVPAPVITLALQRRLRSRVDESFADKLLAAMRHEFGGHDVKSEE